MASFTEIREALAATLTANISGLRAVPRLVVVQTPTAVIELERIEYHDASMNQPLWFLNVTVLVSLVSVEAAQIALDDYLAPEGASSIRAALEGDPTLGGVVDDVTVREAGDYRSYTVSGTEYLGARFSVEVR